MNVAKTDLEKLLKLLPALTAPTISPLADPDWVDVYAVIEEKLVRELIPDLRQCGARGIIESPLNKIIH